MRTGRRQHAQQLFERAKRLTYLVDFGEVDASGESVAYQLASEWRIVIRIEPLPGRYSLIIISLNPHESLNVCLS